MELCLNYKGHLLYWEKLLDAQPGQSLKNHEISAMLIYDLDLDAFSWS